MFVLEMTLYGLIILVLIVFLIGIIVGVSLSRPMIR